MKGRPCVERVTYRGKAKPCPAEGRIFCGEDGRWRCLTCANTFRAYFAATQGKRQFSKPHREGETQT